VTRVQITADPHPFLSLIKERKVRPEKKENRASFFLGLKHLFLSVKKKGLNHGGPKPLRKVYETASN